MDRSDFVESRIDVIKNMYTLYSYAKSESSIEKTWALERFKLGRWYVVEQFGDKLIFAPSRFIGYKNNTIEKHSVNHGDGTQTNNLFSNLKLYKEVTDDYLSDEFEKFMFSLGIKKSKAKFFIAYNLETSDLKRAHKCYFISPTHCIGQKEDAWKSFFIRNIMAIGWKDTDYTNYSIKMIEEDYTNDPTAIPAFTLLKHIQEGDIICCTNNAHGLWGIGIAVSSYKFQQKIHYAGKDKGGFDSYYSHYIDVAWLCFNEKGYIRMSELKIQPPEKQWQPYGTITQKIIPQYIYKYLLRYNNNNMKDPNQYKQYINLLEANKNLILTGAPGTGKTYLAKEIAKKMNAETEFVQFHPSYDYTDFLEGLRPVKKDGTLDIGFELKDGIFKSFCKRAISASQYETSLKDEDIETAIQQFKEEMHGKAIPNINDDQSFGIEVKNNNIFVTIHNQINNQKNESKQLILSKIISNIKGQAQEKQTDSYEAIVGEYISKYFLQREINTDPSIYVFIIDEINRGEISKIFGELFFCIDPGYRGEEGLVKTQYQNLITDESDPFYDGFYIPKNVYIIGTMNDIDRSVESLDFAMRRRFAWKEIKANTNTGMLDELEELKDEIVEKMNLLNTVIWDEQSNVGIEGLSTAYHIGGAYFRKLTLYLNENRTNIEEAYKNLWENHLQGLLFEYLRGSANATENLKTLEKTYYKGRINDKLEG